MSILKKLDALRKTSGQVLTQGLSDDSLAKFIETDSDLVYAIEQAALQFANIASEYPKLIDMDEKDQMTFLQEDFVNFYAADAVNPYVAVAARGPWIITLKGAVIHDNGGYGMLGAGHAPQYVLDTMHKSHVMANIMTPSIEQKRLADALKKEIGHRREKCPFSHFICMNSGSESVTVASRISDVNAKRQTDTGGRHAGKEIKIMSLKGAFHGRTDRPAQYSDSSLKTYKKNLASFNNRNNLITVPVNDIDALKAAFSDADKNNIFIESFFIEPVMGEGNPGMAITPEFYQQARALTESHGSLLLVDSIQAGLRAQGCLSIIDYPGFEHLAAPDMETYSKALNAGHYPLSVLALNKKAAENYVVGIYGNTMTANPKALDVACAVLDQLTPSIRENIQKKGAECVKKLKQLQAKYPSEITGVQGTGLLFSCELNTDFKAYGSNSIEEFMRYRGIGVIHGGENSLRFTPHFKITSAEIDLIIEGIEYALNNGPKANSLDKAS